MTTRRMDETTLDTRLDSCLHAADLGDPIRARQVHELLDRMLSERETAEGRYWLTDHGRSVLADMHRQLSRCQGEGAPLKDEVLGAVHLKAGPSHWQDSCSYVRDLKIAIAVANELCEQRSAGGTPDLNRAARAVARTGDFGLNPSRISEVYEHVAASVGGFREIAHC